MSDGLIYVALLLVAGCQEIACMKGVVGRIVRRCLDRSVEFDNGFFQAIRFDITTSAFYEGFLLELRFPKRFFKGCQGVRVIMAFPEKLSLEEVGFRVFRIEFERQRNFCFRVGHLLVLE